MIVRYPKESTGLDRWPNIKKGVRCVVMRTKITHRLAGVVLLYTALLSLFSQEVEEVFPSSFYRWENQRLAGQDLPQRVRPLVAQSGWKCRQPGSGALLFLIEYGQNHFTCVHRWGAVGWVMRIQAPVCLCVPWACGGECNACTSWVSLPGAGDGHQCSLDGFLFPNKHSYDTMSESSEDFLSPLGQSPACCKPGAIRTISSPPLPSTLSLQLQDS